VTTRETDSISPCNSLRKNFPKFTSKIYILKIIYITSQVIVKGIESIKRTVIQKEQKNGVDSYILLLEGYGLLDVMVSQGINPQFINNFRD